MEKDAAKGKPNRQSKLKLTSEYLNSVLPKIIFPIYICKIHASSFEHVTEVAIHHLPDLKLF